jgi:NADH dehydrogenase FAD-containing subunit
MRSQFVIVGGGAGGLELACKLGRKLGPEAVMLVDSRLFHIWKPSLHEVAAGTLDVHQEGLSYQMLAHDNGFTFVYGPMLALDAQQRLLTVGAIASEGEEILPQRQVRFDQLVIAVGSVANHFGVPGAAEHTISLNATEDAERFRLTLLKLLTLAEPGPTAAWTWSSSAAAPPASSWRPSCAKPAACMRPTASASCRPSAMSASRCWKARRASRRRCRRRSRRRRWNCCASAPSRW